MIDRTTNRPYPDAAEFPNGFYDSGFKSNIHLALNALTYALKQIQLPIGRGLWLCCDPLAAGDVYSPWHAAQTVASGATPPDDFRFHASVETLEASYDYVVLSTTKQLAESEGLLALALERSKGLVIVVAAKDAGGGRLAGMMDAYGVTYGELSKDRCRIVWTFAAPQAKRDSIAKNLANLAARTIKLEGETWWSVPGLFGWDKIDAGSRILLQHMPQDLTGYVADFGCGYGYISANLARNVPGITKIDAYDADARAVALAARNSGEKVHPVWQDIRKLFAPLRYDAVVMNPPFHSGKHEDVDLGETFIRKAWESLKPRGRLFLVANRQLPYEKIVIGLTILHEGDGFKVITGRRT
eukprot:gene14063-14181_t